MRVNEDFIKEKVQDDCVLVPVGEKYQNGVFTLNESAERIYDLLREGKERDELVTILCTEYSGSDAAEVAAFVDGYLDELRKFGVIAEG